MVHNVTLGNQYPAGGGAHETGTVYMRCKRGHKPTGEGAGNMSDNRAKPDINLYWEANGKTLASATIHTGGAFWRPLRIDGAVCPRDLEAHKKGLVVLNLQVEPPLTIYLGPNGEDLRAAAKCLREAAGLCDSMAIAVEPTPADVEELAT